MHLRGQTKVTEPAQVEKYFIKKRDEAAYYAENQEFNGFWGGKAAKMMGLKDYMNEKEFSRLCHNLHPITGEQLTPRMKEKRRIGYDFNWNCPKSVSVLYAFTKDERIIQVARQGWRRAMDRMEEYVGTRVRVGGRDEDRPTRNWVYGEFVHLTARPENGVPDPHLHAHCYAFNVTWDPVEKRFKAAQMGNLIEELAYFQGACAMEVGEGLKKLGLEIVPTKDAFEIAGISRELIEKFSRRTKTIEAKAEKLGVTDPKQKAMLGAQTRENKNQDLTIPELEGQWWPRLSTTERQALERAKAMLQRSRAAEMSQQVQLEASASIGAAKTSEILGTQRKVKAAGASRRQSMNQKTRPGEMVNDEVTVTEHDRRAVALAVEHLFERQSVVSEKRLMAEAFKSWCIGKATLGGIERVVAEASLLRREWKGKLMVTTAEVLAEETRCIDACVSGKGQFEPMNSKWRIHDRKLNEGQRGGVSHVLNSCDFVTGISGKSGTGKTTLLHEAKRAIEAGGYKLLVLTPGAEAAHDVLPKQGFKEAETVAKLLASGRLQSEAAGAVWWVDEAGLLSTRQADRLLALAKELGARVVMVGDTGQHHAVERGQAFDLLQKSGKMEVASVNEIVRQRGIYKRIVELAEARKTEELFNLMSAANFIFEGTIEERQKLLAQDYVAVIEKGKSAWVVAPTHAECRDVTKGIRDALKERGLLKAGRNTQFLQNLSWTDAMKRDPDHYKCGMVVQINGHLEGYALGEKLEVVSVTESTVLGRAGNRIKELPLSEPKSFGVYERKSIELCAGDRIRVTSNGRTADGHRINNGNLFTVKRIDSQGRIVLNNGWRLEKEFGHLQWGYAMTSISSQGKDVDYVFLAQSPELSYAASDANQVYVSISRGREGMKLYTTDIEMVRELAARERKRTMATELFQGGEESQVAEMSVGTGNAVEMGLSEKLGKSDGLELTREAAEELQRIILKSQEAELERERETGMAMGM